jgi:ferredoxin
MSYTLTILPDNAQMQLAANAPITDIEYEPGGRDIIPFGCRAGACGACAIEVLEGGESLSEQQPAEANFLRELGFAGPRFRLACQCRVSGNVTIRLAEPA